MESLSGQHSGGLGLQLQMGNDVADKTDNSADEMGDDAAQAPRSVADKAYNIFIPASETMGQYLRTTKMDQQKVWQQKLKYMALPICLAQRLLCIVLQAPATNG